MKPIIVMAGTPVDTRMGMDCLSSHGLTGVFCPVSENPNQQTAFQISPMEKMAAAVTALLRTAQAEHGCGKALRARGPPPPRSGRCVPRGCYRWYCPLKPERRRKNWFPATACRSCAAGMKA